LSSATDAAPARRFHTPGYPVSIQVKEAVVMETLLMLRLLWLAGVVAVTVMALALAFAVDHLRRRFPATIRSRWRGTEASVES
jgi:hypothetical protein